MVEDLTKSFQLRKEIEGSGIASVQLIDTWKIFLDYRLCIIIVIDSWDEIYVGEFIFDIGFEFDLKLIMALVLFY